MRDCRFERVLESAIYKETLGLFKSDSVYVDQANKWHIDKEGEGTLKVIRCCFYDCASRFGGAIQVYKANTTLDQCNFYQNRGKNGGATTIQDAVLINVTRCLYVRNEAKRFGDAHYDGHEETDTLFVRDCNYTMSHAREWIGSVRLQHNQGSLLNCVFHGVRAKEFGALWDYSHHPGKRSIKGCSFFNNSVEQHGACITVYHLHFTGTVEDCVFMNNRNGNALPGTALYLHSDRDIVTVVNCVFDEPKAKSMLVYFDDTSKIIDHGNRFSVDEKLSWETVLDDRCL